MMAIFPAFCSGASGSKMYGGVHPLPAVVGVKLGMCTPHGRKPATKRCRASQATAASALGSRDSRYGKRMATPAAPRNFRLLNLDFIAVVSLVEAIRVVLRLRVG